jgi:hypothetical protein
LSISGSENRLQASLGSSALQAAGFTDTTVELCPGPQFLKNYRDFIAHRSLHERVESLFPGEEQAAAAEYVADAERGASFVTVHAPHHADRNRARAILAAHHGLHMRYYGEATITDLD